ncbi:DUF4259 domain-containing protein [Acidaminobacter sp. JC074]|uniref:DUF4259 domain-containing protein n=1 Tax=Acidaminobacter sp. JC074 TaxID=2530199 RepID=UPI001F10866F|nr:DUF4259 domain-containing protein [Acidaminobacter sp. JC074]MCH4887410.1 DUF4259 domain-containing protein [Acidaminobacter sp. JC074]
MGAWGYKSFENDDAVDFLDDLSETRNTKSIIKVFDKTTHEPDYLEAPLCSEALAAAELVCLITEGEVEALPSSVIDWYKSGLGLFKRSVKFSPADIKKAAYAVEKIINESELKELWEESEDFGKWKKNNEDLVNRLLSYI